MQFLFPIWPLGLITGVLIYCKRQSSWIAQQGAIWVGPSCWDAWMWDTWTTIVIVHLCNGRSTMFAFDCKMSRWAHFGHSVLNECTTISQNNRRFFHDVQTRYISVTKHVDYCQTTRLRGATSWHLSPTLTFSFPHFDIVSPNLALDHRRRLWAPAPTHPPPITPPPIAPPIGGVQGSTETFKLSNEGDGALVTSYFQ